jgi:hypothetical protein
VAPVCPASARVEGEEIPDLEGIIEEVEGEPIKTRH